MTISGEENKASSFDFRPYSGWPVLIPGNIKA